MSGKKVSSASESALRALEEARTRRSMNSLFSASYEAQIRTHLKEVKREFGSQVEPDMVPADQIENRSNATSHPETAGEGGISGEQKSDKDRLDKGISLEKHSVKSWFKSAISGMFIGLAVVVPGISGATISIIFKLYEKIIFAISSLLKQFKRSVIWLLPLIVGMAVGVIGGFFGVKEALNYIPFATVCLFAGLMIGAFPTVYCEVARAKKSPLRIIMLILGVVVPVGLSVLTTNVIHADAAGDPLAVISWWEYLYMILAGAVVALTQIVPGLSASSFMMMIGYFTPIVNSISLTYWKSNPLVFAVYGCLVLGFLVGLIAFSKLINVLLEKKRETTFFPIVGLSIGSIICMFYNPEIYKIYQGWIKGGNSSATVSMWTDIDIAVALLLVGFAISISFVIYERNRAKRSLAMKGKNR
ncbi:MAG TPA: hypothetical protein DEA32_01655 [Firmicutes bacterium]|nr:hypothetical protein [Bacillota bacterium]